MPEKIYKITDPNGNNWKLGLKDLRGKGKLSAYIKVNDHRFILSNFSTRKSALEWWSAFSSMLKMGETK